jgi:uncharacterized protein DUF4349/putative zinc finger protein
MSRTAHPVAPEEVMAHLDGELPTARDRSVSSHLESCAACQELVHSLGSTAHSLSSWTVGTPEASLDEHVFQEPAKREGSGGARENALRGLRMFWSRPLPWALAGLALAVLFGTQNLTQRASHFDSFMTYSRKEAAANGDSLPASKSTVALRLVGPSGAPAPPAAPFAAPHGRYQGLAVPAKNSLAINGPLLAGEASEQLKEQHSGYRGWLQTGPMIARTVSLSLLAKDFDSSRASLDAILVRHNGYAADLNVATPVGAARSLQASLRIPAPQLPAALGELKSLGRVELETQNGEEVTEQHADLVARLKNSRETEQRLQAILAQRTGKISEVLEVEQEIARVRGEIEQMEAEQKNLEQRVDFATIDLKLSEEYKAKLDSPAPAISTLIRNSAVNGYRNVRDTLLSVVLFFAEYGPVLVFWLLLFFIPAWLVWRRRSHAVAV